LTAPKTDKQTAPELTDKSGHVILGFEGCEPSILVERIELPILLHGAILHRIKSFEDAK